MCLEVRNLFSDKDVILSTQDIYDVAKYAIEKGILSIDFDDTYRNYDFGIEGHTLESVDYTIVYKGDNDAIGA